MMSSLYWFMLGALGVWRVTYLFTAEDGPGDVLVKLRNALGDGWLRSLVACFYCLSLWVALPFAALIGSSIGERALMWLALSGAACLLQRLTSAADAPGPPIYWEDKENEDGMLRRRADESEPPK